MSPSWYRKVNSTLVIRHELPRGSAQPTKHCIHKPAGLGGHQSAAEKSTLPVISVLVSSLLMVTILQDSEFLPAVASMHLLTESGKSTQSKSSSVSPPYRIEFLCSLRHALKACKSTSLPQPKHSQATRKSESTVTAITSAAENCG